MEDKGASIKDAADAVKAIVQAVPVYQDVVQPAAREVGTALATVTKTIHVALAPVSAMVWGYDQLKEFLERQVAEKLLSTPPERIQPPPPHVAGPALEALRYAGHDETLRDLYANLLATALDADTVRNAHPAFVEILKALSPDEARLLRLFSRQDAWPIVELRAWVKDHSGYQVRVRSFSLMGQEAGCVAVDLTSNYLDNLTRLGLIEAPWNAHLTEPGTYEPLEGHSEIAAIVKQLEASEMMPQFERGFVRPTALGRQFIRSCVVDRKASASAGAV